MPDNTIGDFKTMQPGGDAPRAASLNPGDTLGQYKVVRLLGRGGMGEVYEVEHGVLSQADQSIRLSMSMGASLGDLPTEIPSGAGTSTRSLIGTYEYMSPEQKRGQEATAASDVYAVGLMMCRLLTGKTQPGSNRPFEEVAGLNPSWDAAILQALEEVASDRFADAGAMLAALSVGEDKRPPPSDRAARTPPTTPTPPTVPPRAAAASHALLDIVSEPPGAEVILDGGDRKVKTPCTIEKFPVGEHHYRAEIAGERISGRFTVADYEHRLELRFDKALAEHTEQEKAGELTTVDLGDGATLDLVYVPAGTFMMGSDDREDEKPVHEVRISRGYWLGRTPVTQEQWELVMGGNPSWFQSGRVLKEGLLGFGRKLFEEPTGRHPVESVSWDGCQKFCEKLTGRERVAGRLPDGCVYRLPTEAEWEYAARGGAKSGGFTYAGSNNVDEVAWYTSNSGGKTNPVGRKKPNELGLCDMSGNVWEWCQDWYGDYPAGSVTDPFGPRSGTCRVDRGGSWDDNARYCRAAYRYGYVPGYRRLNYLGFRLLRAVP